MGLINKSCADIISVWLLFLSFLSVLLVARLWRRGRLLREHAELVQGEAVHRATETQESDLDLGSV